MSCTTPCTLYHHLPIPLTIHSTPHTLHPIVHASLATGPRQNDGTFYEIRTYDVKPSKMKEFVELVNKHIHLRAAHSEMVGFWTVELGGMNKAIHIWKFDNFVHRAEVRKALANDKEWQGKFLSPVLPFLNKQNNEIVYLVPWCEIGKPSKEGGELYLTAMKGLSPVEAWCVALRNVSQIHNKCGCTLSPDEITERKKGRLSFADCYCDGELGVVTNGFVRCKLKASAYRCRGVQLLSRPFGVWNMEKAEATLGGSWVWT
uniref:NIPSNAP domain-containing protein n=1 Tax=Chelonoidis abingdonii TaxID=106734 RepID=A0A8C0H035_CHEAB